MFLNKLLAAIGAFFTGMFHETEKAWAKTSTEFQAALKIGSSIINTFNELLNGSPSAILDQIRKDFPILGDPKLLEMLNKVSIDFGIAESAISPDLLTTVMNIQKVIIDKKLEGDTAWSKICHAGYLAISAFLAPAGTKFAPIVMFAEYVYHDLIKGGK